MAEQVTHDELVRACAVVSQAQPRDRQGAVDRAAYQLGRAVAAGELDAGAVVESLLDASGLRGTAAEAHARRLAGRSLDRAAGRARRGDTPEEVAAEAPALRLVVDHDVEREAIQAEGAPRGPRFPLLTGADLAEPLPPIRWAVEGLEICPGRPCLVAGFGFSAKTLSMQALLLAVATGTRAWGHLRVGQGPVVHLDWEQGRRMTASRYQRLALAAELDLGALGPALRYSPLPTLMLDHPAAEDAVVAATGGAALCLVDSLRAAAPGVDENDSSSRRVLDMLTRASERTKCAFVVIHHARKPSKDSAGGAKMAIRGSGAIFDACSSVLIFDGSEKGEPVRVTHEKASVTGQLAEPFYLRVEDVADRDGRDPHAGLRLQYLTAEQVERADDGVKPERVFDELRDRVIALLRRGPQRSANAIVPRIAGSRPRVLAAVRDLTEDGTIVNVGGMLRLANV